MGMRVATYMTIEREYSHTQEARSHCVGYTPKQSFSAMLRIPLAYGSSVYSLVGLADLLSSGTDYI